VTTNVFFLRFANPGCAVDHFLAVVNGEDDSFKASRYIRVDRALSDSHESGGAV